STAPVRAPRRGRASSRSSTAHRVVPCSLYCRLASNSSAGRETKGLPIMLVLTEAAAEVVKSVTDTPQAPDGTGLRITQSAPDPDSGTGLELAAAAEPGADDQVVETGGARVFLDQR